MKRITNEQFNVTDPNQAKSLLRTRHLQTDTVAPGLPLLDALVAAYPESQRPDADGVLETDWQDLAWRLAMDYVPAFQSGKAQGRPTARKDGLVAAVEALLANGEASSITHACNILEVRKVFPEITSVRRAYYRRKNLSR